MAGIIKWDDNDFSVSVESIDEQHKQIFLLVNKLYDAFLRNETHNQLSVILNELVEHTIKHFSHEETCFKRFGYLKCKEHTDQHCDLVQKVSEFKKAFEAGNAEISQDILFFLRDWLIDHIGKSDKKFTPFMLENGVK